MKRALVILLSLAFMLVAQLLSATETNTNTITLSECFEQVLAHDAQILQLQKDIERASGTRLVFHARDLPNLHVEPQVGIRGGKLYDHTAPYALVTAGFSQPLFNTGMAASWRRGNLEIIAAEQNLNNAVANRLYAARVLFLRAQRLHELIALHEGLETRLQTNVTVEHQRHDVGLTGPRPELQARVRLFTTHAELTDFRREESDVLIDLAELMGGTLNSSPHPTGEWPHDNPALDLKALAHSASEQRADLKFLRTLIRLTDEDRRVVQAGYFPNISAIGSSLYIPGRKRAYQVTPIIEGQYPLGTDIRGGVSLTWQIIDNGSVTGPSRRAVALRGEYETILDELEQNIPRELDRITRSLQTTDAKLAALQKSTDEAEETLRLIESRITLGEATQLDFFDAQRNLFAVRHAVVDAEFQHAIAFADLDRVIGRYLEFAEPAKNP